MYQTLLKNLFFQIYYRGLGSLWVIDCLFVWLQSVMVCLCFTGGGGHRGSSIKPTSSVHIPALAGIMKDASIMDMASKGNAAVHSIYLFPCLETKVYINCLDEFTLWDQLKL